ncbi:MAG TPA: cytochrome c, partial [Bordetella sp.]|nr:cytochrome c [Bordetella sp.]
MARLYSATTGLAGILVSCALLGSAQAEPDMLRQGQLEHLLRQDCGSCHGLRMTGGLGPPLTRQALAGKPRDL